MSRNRKWYGALLGILLVGMVGYLTFRSQRQSREEVCQSCWREIHPSLLTVGEVNGKATRFCCPACAMTTAQQNGKPVRLIRLTDFNTHQPLDPKNAFLLRGSDINPDLHPKPLVDQDKQPYPVHFDRCAPSILAFQTREAAENFRRDHGGELLQAPDLKPYLTVE